MTRGLRLLATTTLQNNTSFCSLFILPRNCTKKKKQIKAYFSDDKKQNYRRKNNKKPRLLNRGF